MMIRRITLLVAAALLALAMSVPVALAAPPEPPEGCVKEQGQWVCIETVEGKNPHGKFDETTTTQGNLENFSPEPQGVGTEEECNRLGGSDKCPPALPLALFTNLPRGCIRRSSVIFQVLLHCVQTLR